MDAFGIIAIILGILGIIGGFLPILPGPPLSWVALLLVYFSDNANGQVSGYALLIWGLIAAVLTVLDYILPGILTKLTGGHKSAQKGATIGLIVGLFLTPIGMVLGSFLGAFFAEMIAENQDFATSFKVACGTFLAFILTTGMKVIFSAILLWKIFGYLF